MDFCNLDSAWCPRILPGFSQRSPLVRYFERYLLQKAISQIKFNIPEEWAKNYFVQNIFLRGNITILNTDKFGVIPQAGQISGFDLYYNPSFSVVNNPYFDRTYTLKIGINCEVIQLTPDYRGIADLIRYYGDLLAETATALNINIKNSKLAYVFAAKNQAAAESFRKMVKQIDDGETAAVADKKLFNPEDGKPEWDFLNQNINSNYIAPDLLQLMRQLEQEYDTKIGINNANTDKKERLILDEVNANNEEIESLIDLWVFYLNESMKRANDMFGLDLSAKKKEVKTIVSLSATDGNRANVTGRI